MKKEPWRVRIIGVEQHSVIDLSDGVVQLPEGAGWEVVVVEEEVSRVNR